MGVIDLLLEQQNTRRRRRRMAVVVVFVELRKLRFRSILKVVSKREPVIVFGRDCQRVRAAQRYVRLANLVLANGMSTDGTSDDRGVCEQVRDLL